MEDYGPKKDAGNGFKYVSNDNKCTFSCEKSLTLGTKL